MLHEQIVRLTDKIRTYDKENLDEMLFTAGEGVRLIAETDRVRIYLEDLTRGALSCVYASGPFADNLRPVAGLPRPDDRQAGRIQRQPAGTA